jgi:hypothetical protein
MKRPRGHRQPAGCLPAQINRHPIHGFAIGQALQRLQRDHRGHHIRGHAGPAPTRRKQIREQLIGKQHLPMRRQERKNTARLEKMTRYRLRVQQLPLAIRSTLHTTIITNNHYQQTERHAALFRSFLVALGR